MSNTLQNDLLNHYGKFMHLKLFVDSSDTELLDKYIGAINEHHLKISDPNGICHIDAGFDLFSPLDNEMSPSKVNKLDYNVICSAQIVEKTNFSPSNHRFNTSFYMYPRSSISKSNLRLANNIGIIDAGYRGHLTGMFDVIYSSTAIKVNKFDRHLQICAPGLIPIIVKLVNSREELGEETARGSGGFGSTGK
jgi:dUTPase